MHRYLTRTLAILLLIAIFQFGMLFGMHVVKPDPMGDFWLPVAFLVTMATIFGATVFRLLNR